MSPLDATNSPIVAAYRERTPKSAALAAEAAEVFPSGIVHDSRRTDPYAVYVDHADGSRKWDVDGNEYIDYFGGHGSLLLGHAHPSLTEAVNRQIARGTHPAACHELELRWGRLVKQLVPAAERVRFTSSGTEANLMAIRLARAYTGRTKLMRFTNHFHGWQDHVAFGSKYHLDTLDVPGVLKEIIDNVIVADPADEADVFQRLADEGDDIAAVILEPTGASSGQIPLGREFAARLREATQTIGAVLIFDEVVTGFRVSPGGAQAKFRITPDLCAFAKILGGGLPAGAVAGRADIMELLDFDAAAAAGRQKVPHQGTFNANPLSAAAGVALLEQVAETDIVERANRAGDRLRDAWNAVFAEEGVGWAAYGHGSCVYVFTNPDGLDIDPRAFEAERQSIAVMEKASGHPAIPLLRLALLVNGVDMSPKPGALVSAVHTEADIVETAEAMRRSLKMMKAEGAL